MNGVQLAHAVREQRPDVKVLLTSGYVGELAALEDNPFPLIDKPYQRATLSARLREILKTEEAAPPKKARARA
jgi:YesN/AraC family two-component response regulator